MSSDAFSAPAQRAVLPCPPKLLIAIIAFAAIAPGVLMTAPAIAAQLAAEWRLTPAQIGRLFACELGAMSLATLPAWWWMSRINWRRVAWLAAGVFLLGNLASALVSGFGPLLALRFIASLAGGTLMILCITCAAGVSNASRVYACWVLGQLALGAIGLLALPPLFAQFGLMAVYLLLAALMLCCLPLIAAFPDGYRPAPQTTTSRRPAPVARKLCAVAAVLCFYISLSAVWTFIGNIGAAAGLSAVHGASVAALTGDHRQRQRLMVFGYLLLLTSIMLLFATPQLARFAAAAVLFKFTWTFVLPFMLATVAGLDNNGKLMNGINLVIGGGMAIGPLLAGYLLQFFGGFGALLGGALSCALLSLLLISLASRAPRAPFNKESAT